MTTSSPLRSLAASAAFSLFVECTPSPSSRPRVAKFGTYYVKTYTLFLADCKRQMAVTKPATPMDGDLAVRLSVVIACPKKTVRVRPVGDVDNYAKGPLDGAKGFLWHDDDQVTSLHVTKRWASPGETPGVHVSVMPASGKE